MHITQKPVELMRDLVKVCVPGGTVIDPCAGSGSTGVAALAEGRSFLGIELGDGYRREAEERRTSTSPISRIVAVRRVVSG